MGCDAKVFAALALGLAVVAGAGIGTYVALRKSPSEKKECEERKKFLEEQLAKAASPDAFLKNLYSEKNPKVLFIGEIHPQDLGKSYYPKLVDHLKNEGVDCIQYEGHPDMQKAVEGYLAGKLPYRVVEGISYKYFNEPPTESFLQATKKANIKLRYVDKAKEEVVATIQAKNLNSKSPELNEITLQFMEKRNREMAQSIAESHLRGECKKSAVIVGLAHLYEVTALKGKYPVSVQDYVAQNSLSTAQIGVISSKGKNGNPLKPIDCDWALTTSSPVGFKVPKGTQHALYPHLPLEGVESREAPWSILDGMIVVQ